MWITRDKNIDYITVWKNKPVRHGTMWTDIFGNVDNSFQISVDELKLFHDIKFEDEPIEVELKIVDKKKSKVEKLCNTCLFKNESPRCMTGEPCDEWREYKRKK